LYSELRARQEYLRASADGDSPFQHEWPEWLLGPGPFSVGCHSLPLERLSVKRDRKKQTLCRGTQNRHGVTATWLKAGEAFRPATFR
jgi:hypothetical protein